MLNQMKERKTRLETLKDIRKQTQTLQTIREDPFFAPLFGKNH